MSSLPEAIETVGPPNLAEYRDELADAYGSLTDDHGLTITAASGKNPAVMGKGWQDRHGVNALSANDFAKLVDGQQFPAIGVMLGPHGGIIDFDIDSDSDARALVDLLDSEPIPMPCYRSGRDGGKHYWARFPARLAALARGVINYESPAGDVVRVAVGGAGKGGHSVCPPSWHTTDKDGPLRWTGNRYEWLPGASLDDIPPPELPERVIDKLVAATEPSKPVAQEAAGSGDTSSAVAAMLNSTKNMEDRGDGSKRLFTVACRTVELNLSDADAITAVRQYEQQRPFPVARSDSQILDRVRDAEREVTRGSELTFSNGVEFEVIDEKTGEPKTAVAPLSMPDIRTAMDEAFDKWPRRIGNLLFIDDPVHGLGWLENPDSLFGWFQSKRRVRWHGGKEAVSRQNVFAEAKRTAIRYDAVESLPHFPPLANHYYRGCAVTPGDGRTLWELISRFTPSTTVDRDLIAALIVTTFWGGRPGSRPAFVITSDAGRGAGKTTLVEMVAALAGGLLDFAAGEDAEIMKQRLLSPAALSKRIALIDNVKRTRFSWAELEALVTTPTISGKRLYHGEAQRPNTITWAITLNGVALSTDLAQRAVIIKLDRATYSGTWKDETLRFIETNRDALVADVAGFFQGDPWPLHRASRWGAWEAEVLARMPEPGEAQAVILERQSECDADGDDGAMIDEYVGEQLANCGYTANRAQVRIPNQVLAHWFVQAMGEPMKTTAVTRRLKQMADEGQVRRLRPDPGRRHGRCFIYTGPNADVLNDQIMNDLEGRLPIHMRR